MVSLTFRIQRSHVSGFICIERPHLNLVIQDRFWKLLKEHLVDGHVECRDHFLRITNKLAVQIFVEASNVSAVHVQERRLQGVDLETTKHG